MFIFNDKSMRFYSIEILRTIYILKIFYMQRNFTQWRRRRMKTHIEQSQYFKKNTGNI